MSLRRAEVRRSGMRILEPLSFELQPGDLAFVRGSNGSGKSTLLRMIAGLISPSEGELSIDGQPAPLSASSRRKVSAAIDEPAFWPWMTARQTLRTVADLAGKRIDVPERSLKPVGLDASRFAVARGKRVGNFSQGMRKRLQVACAVALDRPILLLDEPTGSLDDDGARLIWKLVQEQCADGKVVVVATHGHDWPVTPGSIDINLGARGAAESS